MPIAQEIKDRAYAIDPECWVSYSGKPKGFKQVMDSRRTASLKRAAKDHYVDVAPIKMPPSLREFADDLRCRLSTCVIPEDESVLNTFDRCVAAALEDAE